MDFWPSAWVLVASSGCQLWYMGGLQPVPGRAAKPLATCWGIFLCQWKYSLWSKPYHVPVEPSEPIVQQQPASLLAKLMSHLGSPAPMDLQMQVVSVNIWLRPPHPPNRMAPLSPVNPQTMMDNNTLLFKLWGSLLYGSKALSPRVVVKSKWGNAC